MKYRRISMLIGIVSSRINIERNLRIGWLFIFCFQGNRICPYRVHSRRGPRGTFAIWIFSYPDFLFFQLCNVIVWILTRLLGFRCGLLEELNSNVCLFYGYCGRVKTLGVGSEMSTSFAIVLLNTCRGILWLVGRNGLRWRASPDRGPGIAGYVCTAWFVTGRCLGLVWPRRLWKDWRRRIFPGGWGGWSEGGCVGERIRGRVRGWWLGFSSGGRGERGRLLGRSGWGGPIPAGIIISPLCY